MVTVSHNCVHFILYKSVSVEHDDHYVKIAGQVTSNLNSHAWGGGEVGFVVDNSSVQSLRG